MKTYRQAPVVSPAQKTQIDSASHSGRRNYLSQILFGILSLLCGFISHSSFAANFQVYGVKKELSMGIAGETPRRDLYVDAGSKHGIQMGQSLLVFRKAPTYDLVQNKFFKDVQYPIAVIRVIHVESDICVARLDRMLPESEVAVASPPTVIAGDLIQIVKE